MKKILWLTESWSFDTDKEIVPYLKEHSGYQITWLVVGPNSIPLADEYVCIKQLYRLKDFRNIWFYYNLFRKYHIKDFDLIYSSFHGFPFYYPTLLLSKRNNQCVVHAAHNVNPYPVWPLMLKIAVKWNSF